MNNGLSEKYWFWGPLLLASLLIYVISLTRSNQDIFFWLNHLSRYTGDSVWAYLTICGDGLVCFVLLLPWIRRRPDVVLTAAISLMITAMGIQGLKFLFAVPRPPVILGLQTFHVIGKTRVWGSFPSGHTANIFMITGVWISAVSRTWLRIVLLAFAGLVGTSRIVVGVHWPLDILGGVLVGWTAAWIGRSLIRHYSWGVQPFAQRLIKVFLFAAACVLLLLYDTGYPHSLLLQRSIAVTCLVWGSIELIFHADRD